MKTVFCNGNFIATEAATVPIADRSFLYGDGLFETLRCYNGRPFKWQQHWDRFAAGAAFMHLAMPMTSESALAAATQLLELNGKKDVIVRMHLSRGSGLRGYSTQKAHSPVFLITLHDVEAHTSPLKWCLKTSSFRVLKNDPLARVKSGSKLLQIMARNEVEKAGFDEALILNSEDEVAEGTSGNFFWINGDAIFTPPLNAGILPGVTRETIFQLCASLEIPCCERSATLVDVKEAKAAFLTLSSLEIVEVIALDDRRFEGSEVILKLFQGYRRLVALETGD